MKPSARAQLHCAWVQGFEFRRLLFPAGLTSGKRLNLFVLQFSHLHNADDGGRPAEALPGSTWTCSRAHSRAPSHARRPAPPGGTRQGAPSPPPRPPRAFPGPEVTSRRDLCPPRGWGTAPTRGSPRQPRAGRPPPAGEPRRPHFFLSLSLSLPLPAGGSSRAQLSSAAREPPPPPPPPPLRGPSPARLPPPPRGRRPSRDVAPANGGPSRGRRPPLLSERASPGREEKRG